MSQERKAGELILSQLGMFNEAMVLYGTVIEPAIFKGIDECVENFVHDSEWIGKSHLGPDGSWVAPKTWLNNQGEEEPERNAWFEIDVIESHDDYWPALFCGAGTRGGQAGFLFKVNNRIFGGLNPWKKYVNSIITGELMAQLSKLGFKKWGDKNEFFFLPVLLDNKVLAQSWLDYGEFTKDDESLAPLNEALEKLKQAAPIFDQIMQACPVAKPATP